MLETFTSISSSLFLHAVISDNEEFCRRQEEICCPKPRRPASPVFVSSSKHHRAREADWEACQEIKQILLGQLPIMSVVESDVQTIAVVKESRNKKRRFSPRLTSAPPFDPTKSPVKQDNFVSDILFESEDSDDSNDVPNQLFSLATLTSSTFCRRPKLGNSVSNLSALDFMERSEPIMTPPLRSHNPLPMNSQFSNRKVTDGPEFGLLSISPPLQDDEDMLLRRARVKSKHKTDSSAFHPSEEINRRLKKQANLRSSFNAVYNDNLPELDIFGSFDDPLDFSSAILF